MWSRVVEVMLGCWLAVSPFVFGYSADETAFWINDFACASTVIVLALVSFWQPLRHAHVLIAGVGVWMIVFAYLHFGGAIPPGLQSGALVGFLLIMFAVIPNEASLPPGSWHRQIPHDDRSELLAHEQATRDVPQALTIATPR
jgi:hypothetical protein